MAIQTITYGDKQYLNQNADIPATNKVQDTDMNEIKSVVNNNALQITPTVLFENSSGSLSVTLSDSASNYSFLYIETIGLQYTDYIKSNSILISNPNGKTISNASSFYNFTNNQIYVVDFVFSISDTTISISNNQAGTVGANNAYVGSANVIGITKIIGYK